MPNARPSELALVRMATRLGDPGSGLAAIAELRQRLETLEAAHVDEAIQASWSWERVGRALGVTKQSAHARHARRGKRVQQGLVVAGRAREAVAKAKREATRLGHDRVETDHLLLGLLLDDQGPVLEALAACDVTRETVLARMPPARPGPRPEPGVSPHTRAVLEQSMREAVSRGDARLDVEHLFLAVLHEPGGRGLSALTGQGRSAKALEQRLGRALRGQSPSA